MNAWEIAATILIPLLGLLTGALGVKWRQSLKLLKEASEAIVALGLCGLSLHKALEDPQITPEERNDVVEGAKNVGTEFSEAIIAATELFERSR